MKKKHLIAAIAAGAVAITALAAGLAHASSYYYHVVFYSDATYTTPVGEYREYCLNNEWIITPQVTGQTSPYPIETPIGVCPGLGDW